MLIYIIFCLSLTFTINESLLHESAVIRVRSTAKDSFSTYKSPYAICGYQGGTNPGVTTQGVTTPAVTTPRVTTPRVTTPEKYDLLKLIEILEEATKNRKPGPVSLNQQDFFEDSNKPVRSKLVSGHATRKNEFPWQVAITTAYEHKLLCGAAIIGPLYVLTAAHCVQGWNARWIYLRLDAWDLQGNYSVALVSEIKSHPNYSLSTFENDIAVLKLTEEIEFKDSIRPVCLPRENIVIENREATVAGWGKNENGRWTNKLQKVTSYVITNEKCNMAWRNSIYLTNICLESEIGGSCDGDSGGPLVMEDPENSDKYSIIGIVSYGSNICTHKNVPGVYTRVSKFIHWLQQQMT